MMSTLCRRSTGSRLAYRWSATTGMSFVRKLEKAGRWAVPITHGVTARSTLARSASSHRSCSEKRNFQSTLARSRATNSLQRSVV